MSAAYAPPALSAPTHCFTELHALQVGMVALGMMLSCFSSMLGCLLFVQTSPMLMSEELFPSHRALSM